MKRSKLIAFLFSIFLFTTSSFAQLQDGATAPDWTLRDLNGNVWHLYELTAKGKTVFIDVFATWCGPCWHYHKTGALDSLYHQHGPNGSVDQSCYVFLIEGDSRTTISDMKGMGLHSVGNWMKENDIPTINPSEDTISSFATNYNIQYYPTVYMICPDNKVYLVGQIDDKALFEKSKSQCKTMVKEEPKKKKEKKKKKKEKEKASGSGFGEEANSEKYFLNKRRISVFGK